MGAFCRKLVCGQIQVMEEVMSFKLKSQPMFSLPRLSDTIYAAGAGCFIRAAVVFCGIRPDLSIKRQHFWHSD